VEASNLQRFIHNFRDVRDVAFPSPVRPLVHPEVLVEVSFPTLLKPYLNPMEPPRSPIETYWWYVAVDGQTFEPGVSILQLLDADPEQPTSRDDASQPRKPTHHPYTEPPAHTQEGRMRQEIARLGCATLLRMVVRDNFIHADLHPGALHTIASLGPRRRGGGSGALRAAPCTAFAPAHAGRGRANDGIE
jgi:hypothetical protein